MYKFTVSVDKLYPDVWQRCNPGDTKNSAAEVLEKLDVICLPGWRNNKYLTCLKPESSTAYSATGE